MDMNATYSGQLHIFQIDYITLQIVNVATLDLEDVRTYRNAIRSRNELVCLLSFNILAKAISASFVIII